MIESSLAKELGISGYTKPLCLKWTGDMSREERESQFVSVIISGSGSSKQYQMNDARTIKTLDLPIQSRPIEELMKFYKHLIGIPIRGYLNAVPKLLIGVYDDNLRLALPLKAREGADGLVRLRWTAQSKSTKVQLPYL